MNRTEVMVAGRRTTEKKVTMNTTPHGTAGVDRLREEIEKLDTEILHLIRHRTQISRSIGAARLAGGGPRIVYKQEMAVLARFQELGSEGRDLAMVLLRLGRGRLGAQRNDLLGAIKTVAAPPAQPV